MFLDAQDAEGHFVTDALKTASEKKVQKRKVVGNLILRNFAFLNFFLVPNGEEIRTRTHNCDIATSSLKV